MGASYLHKAVDGHNGHIWLTFGIVHQVQVDQLLQLQVVGLHAVHNIRKERAGQTTVSKNREKGVRLQDIQRDSNNIKEARKTRVPL